MESNKNNNKKIKNVTINDKDVISEMLTVADKKAKTFFDIIYSKSSSLVGTSSSQATSEGEENVNIVIGGVGGFDDDDDDEDDIIDKYEQYYSHDQSQINYGNIKDNYDSVKSITSIDSVSQALKKETEKNDLKVQLEFSKSIDLLNLLKSNAKLIQSYHFNINSLSFTRESSINYIIERNRQLYKIMCPYDEYAYFKLDSKITIRNFNDYQNKIESTLDSFNLFNVDSILNDEESINKNLILPFLPNSLSSLTMPFFFDIFQPSELKLIQSSTIDILIKIKNTYLPKSSLDNKLILSNVPSDILWNCFALFNLKFDKKIFKYGFYNYYLSLHALVEYLSKSKYDIDLINQINKMMSHLSQAFLLNGLFDLNDLKTFSNFYDEIANAFLNNESRYNIKIESFHVDYLKKAMNNLNELISSSYPIKLKNLCRIRLKNELISNFNLETIYSNKDEKFKLNENVKNFLFFRDEFEKIYEINKHLFASIKKE
jgi:hypothetical protein